jgi:hypothetical protein
MWEEPLLATLRGVRPPNGVTPRYVRRVRTPPAKIFNLDENRTPAPRLDRKLRVFDTECR